MKVVFEMLTTYLYPALEVSAFGVTCVIIFGTILLARLYSKPKKIDVVNKSIFITGCDSGMGHRMARKCDEMGMRVFAGCLLPEGGGALSLKESCSERLHIVPLDITKEDQVKKAVSYVKQELNIKTGERGLHCLINNAGVLAYSNFELMTLRMCEEVININLMGTIRVTKHFLPIINVKTGRIITVTSIAGRIGIPELTIYSSTKHALEGFFTSLRYELFDKEIHVAILEPGDFSTCTDIIQWTRRHLDEIWENLSPEEKESNLEIYEKTKTRVLTERSCPPSEREKMFYYLLKEIEHAIVSDKPEVRYIAAPFLHKIGIWCLRNLTQSWMIKQLMKAM